jgi:hypothetical protein
VVGGAILLEVVEVVSGATATQSDLSSFTMVYFDVGRRRFEAAAADVMSWFGR